MCKYDSGARSVADRLVSLWQRVIFGHLSKKQPSYRSMKISSHFTSSTKIRFNVKNSCNWFDCEYSQIWAIKSQFLQVTWYTLSSTSQSSHRRDRSINFNTRRLINAVRAKKYLSEVVSLWDHISGFKYGKTPFMPHIWPTSHQIQYNRVTFERQKLQRKF